MHFYQFNIGDYRRRSSHLSPLEHGIYRMLIDTYYLEEKPLSLDKDKLMRTHNIRTEDEIKAFGNILSDFFSKTKKGYKNKTCEEVISKYQEKSEKARASANARWNANASKTHSEGNANHKPITNNHKPITNNKDHSETSVTPNQVIKLWNDLMNGTYARQKKVVTDTLKQTIRSRCKNEFISINDWTKYFEAIKRSDFLMGKTYSDGRKPFQISLEWVVKPANMAKIIEGAYHG